jgi:hypothetical protein
MKNLENSLHRLKVGSNAQVFTCGMDDADSKQIGIIIHKLATKAPLEETLQSVFEYYGYKHKETIKCLLESAIKNSQEKTL